MYKMVFTKNVSVERQQSRVDFPHGGSFHSVKGGSLWTAGVYEVLSLSWRHSDTHTHVQMHEHTHFLTTTLTIQLVFVA